MAKKYIQFLIFSFVVFLFPTCEKDPEYYNVGLPTFENSLLVDTKPLDEKTKKNLEGIFSIHKGSDLFGPGLVLKFNKDKLSFFGEKKGIYAVLDVGENNKQIILEGYWRKAGSGDAGLLRFIIDKNTVNVEDRLLNQDFSGTYWVSNKNYEVSLSFERELKSDNLAHRILIIAHRGGGRTADRMHVSENSLEMLRYSDYLGAQGVEIDVRLTKDKMPILYHDADLNMRLLQKTPLLGNISDYTYEQLSASVRLFHGEKIPTLNQALDIIFNETQLQLVWLDVKDPEVLQAVLPLQKEINENSRRQGRNLLVFVGLPDQTMINAFLDLPDYQNIPCLCETTNADNAEKTNAMIWGYRWTMGTQEEEIQNMDFQGRKVFVWTVDLAGNIKQFISTHRFDGILTNYPTLGAYYYYMY